MPSARKMVDRGCPPTSAPFGRRPPPWSGHMGGRVHGKEAGKPLGVEEEVGMHPETKGRDACLYPALAGTSPEVANDRGRWVGRGRGGRRKLSRRGGERSEKVPRPLDGQCSYVPTCFEVAGVGELDARVLAGVVEERVERHGGGMRRLRKG